MSDVRTMAHVEKFSHLTIPMLWFEIGLAELPDKLEQRFDIYLNILPLVEKAGLYGTLTLGLLLSVIAVTIVAVRTSKSVASNQCYQKFNRNQNNSIYNACEEKLMSNEMFHHVTSVRVDDIKSDDELDEIGSLKNVQRDQYELEEDAALSDIDYNESIDDEDTELVTGSSSEQVC